jgi:hypothetical protein
MSDAQRRALRGLIQVAFVQALIQLYQAFAVTRLTADQVQAITVVATPLVTFAQNWLEENAGTPKILKPSPSGAQNVAPPAPAV